MSGVSWLAALDAGLETVFQVLLLVILAPLVGWCLDALPGWIGGRAPAGRTGAIVRRWGFGERCSTAP